MQPESPWRVPSFRALFAATAVSQLGTNIGYVAVPLVAVMALHASPGQVGLLATLSTIAFLLIGLPAGAWVDRMRHRRVLIAADLSRGVLFGSIPLLWWLGALTLWWLYVIVLASGCATVFFDVGSQSILPQLTGRETLMRANTAIGSLIAASNVAGRSAGGGLAQLLTAPVAIVFTAAGYLASALRCIGIKRSARPPSAGAPLRLRAEITEGLRHVLGRPLLRAIAIIPTVTNFGTQIVSTMLPVLFTRELGLSAGQLGLFWAAGGTGLFLGSFCARPIAARLGDLRTLAVIGVVLAPAGLLVGLVAAGPWLWLAGAGWSLAMFKTGILNVIGVSMRQRETPEALLGRMNATFRFMSTGALAAGSAASGLIGQFASVRAAMWAGGACLAVAFVPVLLISERARPRAAASAEPPAAVAGEDAAQTG